MTLRHILENKIPHRQILFNTDMVCGTLEGRKTQTRRIVSGQFPIKDQHDVKATLTHNGQMAHFTAKGQGASFMGRVNPYGAIGDLLWVRETWRVVGWPWEDTCDGFDIEFSDGVIFHGIQLFDDHIEKLDFIDKLCNELSKKCEPTVNEKEETFSWTKDQIHEHMPWKPSIHMPKAAARIWLKIKHIKVERLRDITDEAATSEGIESQFSGKRNKILFRDYQPGKEGAILYKKYVERQKKNGQPFMPWLGLSSPINSFFTLWDSINGADSWKANPWVWVIEFEVLSIIGAPSLEKLQQINLISV